VEFMNSALMFAGLFLVCFFPFLAVVDAAAGRNTQKTITDRLGLNAQAAKDVDGVRGVVREAVVPCCPVGDEAAGQQVPDLALGTVGEVQRRRRQALQRDGSPVAGHARRGLDEQCLHVLKLLLGNLTHRGSSLMTRLARLGPCRVTCSGRSSPASRPLDE
jgi:hypothetical protein